MYDLTLCRVCLANNVRMRLITNTELQEIYEKLTNIQLQTDFKPLTACYLCCAELRNCRQLMLKALKAEDFFTQILNNGIQPTIIDRQTHNLASNLAVTATEHFTIASEDTSDIMIKVEPSVSYEQELLLKEEPYFEDGSPEKKINIEVSNVAEQEKAEMNPQEYENFETEDEACKKDYDKWSTESKNNTSFNVDLKTDLNKHIGEHTLINSSNIQNKILREYESSENGHLKTHSKAHTCEKPYACHVCDYKCSRKGHLETHLLTHTGEKPFSCHLCDYKCNRNSNLKMHLRSHTGEKPFSCHFCEYKCNNSGDLNSHLKTHTGEKPFACHLCEYKCSRNNNLKMHMRSHTGEKPYSCHLCDYKCRNSSDLKRHLKTHTGEKLFACHLCDYKCSENGTLKTHIRKHTGEKPYACNVCEYKTAHRHRLKSHFNQHKDSV